MPYATFTTDDFCKDPDFIRWVLTPTDESNRFWWAFMADYPHKMADIQRAIDFVTSMQFREIDPSESDLARLKQRIWNDIDRAESTGNTNPLPLTIQRNPWYRQPYWAAAAVLVLVVSVSLTVWTIWTNNALTYETAYGKIQEIQLADGSVVTLNAHSTLRVADKLDQIPVREVWLDGEAYFDIAKRHGAAFIVHTPEATIKVLGTEFNVNTRHKQTNVVLHEGKVQLSSLNQSELVMKPGDMAVVKPQSRKIELKRVQPQVYDTWKESYIVLDGKTVPDIVQNLEDTFGVTIKLADAHLADKTLVGKLRTEVASDCIENLAVILDADVRKEGDTYVFE